MDHPIQLGVAADQRIDLAPACTLGQVRSVEREHVADDLRLLPPRGRACEAAGSAAGPRSGRHAAGAEGRSISTAVRRRRVGRRLRGVCRCHARRARRLDAAAWPSSPRRRGSPVRPHRRPQPHRRAAGGGGQVERRIGPTPERAGQRALKKRGGEAVRPILEGGASRLRGLAIGRHRGATVQGKEDDSTFASSVRALPAVARARKDPSVRLQHHVRVGPDELHHGREGDLIGKKRWKIDDRGGLPRARGHGFVPGTGSATPASSAKYLR